MRALGRPIIGIPEANPVEVTPTEISPGFVLDLTEQGLDALENPSGVIDRFGYLTDGTRTEPDENTYLVLDHNPGGPTEGFDYGRHFLFQGHENSSDLAYITRINLDVAQPDERVTLLTPPGEDGLTHYNSIDGSCWNPFSNSLLFTEEANVNGGVIEISADYNPASARTLYGSIGRGGYEGIHPDGKGNLLIIEDVGGALFGKAKNPNSFVFRFVPATPSDLTQGKLQALQVIIDGEPVVFHAEGDTLSETQLKLHTPGTQYPCMWVTLHDTAVDGTEDFDANALAKSMQATPFKRPENAQFLPGSHFGTFFFDITGDTDADAGNDPELAARGAWGGIFRVDIALNQHIGKIGIVVLGDADHAAFDNLAFSDAHTLLAAEDRGDTLHSQLNKLDSIWAYDVRNPANPTRFAALGLDRLTTDEDNEPTGLHYSDGNPTIDGLLGRFVPSIRDARLFFTQQHGENNVYEVKLAGPADGVQ